ncbi:MAG: DoxX family protein [Saprospiraceae bacterium]|nr:DoxX family protein [Saprospiraceae bacterium]
MIANNKVKLIGMTLVRVLTGVILFKFSLEMFSKDTMSGYIQWLGDIHFPFASKMAYVGKIAEMVGGLSLTWDYSYDGQASSHDHDGV